MDESVEAPQKVTKLSQAIREGAKLRPQAKHGWRTGGCSCAIAAAAEALGLPYQEDTVMDGRVSAFILEKFTPDFFLGACKAYERRHGNLYYDNAIGMPREQIASRLEALGY